jgi:membrane associated rhomboid family serine protease
MLNKLSISNILILLSIIFTLLSFKFQNLLVFWMNNFFIERWEYYYYFLQFFTSNFIHWDLMHLLFNWLFIYIFWNMVEIMLWKNKFILFFIFISIFNWIWLTYFANNQNTIWISWFALALLSYYTLELKSQKNPEYTGWITAILINIAIWFLPWISLLWHLFWTIW